MIDIENKVFTTVSTALTTAFPSILVFSSFTDKMPTFPCVTVDEIDNITYEESLDSNLREHHAVISYEINVYSDLKNGRKSQAKAIADKVDETMQDMKFTRTTYTRVPNEDSTLYRITLRYEAIVDEGTTEGTTTTYQMYRR